MRLQLIGFVALGIACVACSGAPSQDDEQDSTAQDVKGSTLKHAGKSAYVVTSVNDGSTSLPPCANVGFTFGPHPAAPPGAPGPCLPDPGFKFGPQPPSFCIDVPSALFGAVGDTVYFDFSTAGVDVTVSSIEGVGFPAGTHTQSDLGGSVDTMTGTYTANTFSFVDHETNTAEENQGLPYYTVTITRAADTLKVVTNNQGDHVTCQLRRKP